MSRKKKKKRTRRTGTYYDASRRLAASIVFIAPLFAIYQAGLAFDPGVRNGTAPIFQDLFRRFHHLGLVFVNLLLLGLLLLAVWRTRARRLRREGLYAWMTFESCAWAAVMLLIAQFALPIRLALPGLGRELVASAGAGVYEEVLFRFLLMGGLVLMLQRGLGGHPAWVVPLAIAASALLFSYAHHSLGGEAWEENVFWYRAAMGGVLGAIFWTRGLGIVVYAHALYNVAVILMAHGGK